MNATRIHKAVDERIETALHEMVWDIVGMRQLVGLTQTDVVKDYHGADVRVKEGDYLYLFHRGGDGVGFAEGIVIQNPMNTPHKWCCELCGGIENAERYEKRFSANSDRIRAIAWQVRDLPTIMDMEDEISVINKLMRLSMDEISGDSGLFCDIIEDLCLSHTDSGIYEITLENEGILTRFSIWLSDVGSQLHLDLDSKSFGTTYAEMLAEFPSYAPKDK
jgi:hypothetical protein